MRYYRFVSQEYFEPIKNYNPSDEYRNIVEELLPKNWETYRFDIWLGAKPLERNFPAQGFKIHVSAIPQTAEDVIRRVVPLCVEENISFKTTGDRALLSHLNSKGMVRGHAGKFMTLYPPDTDIFRSFIDRVYEVTKELAGPYILSDKRYKDSKVVHYRYGGFQRIQRMTASGMKELVIVDGTGEEVVDTRTPYFQLPNNIDDPFPVDEIEQKSNEPENILGGRYQIEEALKFSNSGGVYRGKDLENDSTVLIKEARPYTHLWSFEGGFLDAPRILEREFEMLRILEPTGMVVKPITLFKEWEHTFLVEEFLDGMILRHFRANDAIIVTPYLDEPERVLLFCSAFRQIALKLIEAVEAVHSHGVVLGDLSPNNVMIQPDTLDICLFDLESAHIEKEKEGIEHFFSTWYTPGFRPVDERETNEVTKSDDYYALGMILYGMFYPMDELVNICPEAIDKIVHRFIEYGLPRQVVSVANALCDGNVSLAKDIVSDWETVQGLPIQWDPMILQNLTEGDPDAPVELEDLVI